MAIVIPAQRLSFSEFLKRKSGILQHPQKEPFGQILAAMHRHNEHFSISVLQYQMRPRLAGFNIAFGAQKPH